MHTSCGARYERSSVLLRLGVTTTHAPCEGVLSLLRLTVAARLADKKEKARHGRKERKGREREREMGLLTIIKKVKAKEKEVRILMVGLDNAGRRP